jgi:hypothetical protein
MLKDLGGYLATYLKDKPVYGPLQDVCPAPGEIDKLARLLGARSRGVGDSQAYEGVESPEDVESNTALPYDSAAARPTPSKGLFKPTRLSRGAARRLLSPTFYLVCPVAYLLQ